GRWTGARCAGAPPIPGPPWPPPKRRPPPPRAASIREGRRRSEEGVETRPAPLGLPHGWQAAAQALPRREPAAPAFRNPPAVRGLGLRRPANKGPVSGSG